MYAVIESGGKQFRVELGSEIEVESLDREPGDTIEFERVLLVADGEEAQIGRPVVDGARVSASVVRQDRGDKLTVFKYRPKARRRVKRGHRQGITLLRVSDIVLGERSAARQAEASRLEDERARAEAEKAAARQAEADRALARRLAKDAEAEKQPPAKAAGTRAGGRSGKPGAKAGQTPKTAETARTRASGTKARDRASAAGTGSRKSGQKASATAPKPSGTTARSRTQAPAPEAKPKRPTRKSS